MPFLTKDNNSLIMQYEDGKQFYIDEESNEITAISYAGNVHKAKIDYKSIDKNKIFYPYGKLATGVIYICLLNNVLYLRKYKMPEVVYKTDNSQNDLFIKRAMEILPILSSGKILDDYFKDDFMLLYESHLRLVNTGLVNKPVKGVETKEFD